MDRLGTTGLCECAQHRRKGPGQLGARGAQLESGVLVNEARQDVPPNGGGSPSAAEAAIAELPSGALVVTAAADGTKAGCLVAFATQCSLEPLRFGVWLAKVNRTYRVALDARTLVVHVLRRGDEDLARRFGEETGDDTDKFRDLAWRSGPSNCPVLERCDWFAGTVVARYDTGDHDAFVLAPHDGEHRLTGPVLPMSSLQGLDAGRPLPPT